MKLFKDVLSIYKQFFNVLKIIVKPLYKLIVILTAIAIPFIVLGLIGMMIY